MNPLNGVARALDSFATHVAKLIHSRHGKLPTRKFVPDFFFRVD